MKIKVIDDDDDMAPNPPVDNGDGGGHDGKEIDGELNDDHNDNDDKR